MSLDPSSNSSLIESSNSFQPFDSLPDEVLLLLLDQLTPFQRCLVLSIWKKWNHTILQRRSWWQYLEIPHHLPFSTALSILQTFNSRSNFTLKHVILQSPFKTPEEIDELFVELNKSSGHVKLLFLNQFPIGGLLCKARRASQEFLPKLNTFVNLCTGYPQKSIKSMWHERGKARVHDEEDKGLQILNVAGLERLEADDLAWFSTLKFLNVGFTDSVKELCAVLNVAKTTLKRLRLTLWEFNEDHEDSDPSFTESLGQIDLLNLEAFFTPKSEASAAALSSLIDVGGQQTVVLFGYVHSLLYFPSLKQTRIRMYDSNALEKFGLNEEEAKVKTILFFERNPSISHLGLVCVGGLQDGKSLHVSFILHSLSPKRRNSGSFEESERESKNVLLPNLRQLTIHDLKALDKKLLKQFWEGRKVIQEDFEIAIYMEGKTFRIDSSGGQDWLDEAESCE